MLSRYGSCRRAASLDGHAPMPPICPTSRGIRMRLVRITQSYSRALAAATLCVIGAANGARAQGAITGRVTAAGTGEPLGDARIVVVGTNAVATSSQDGKYTLTGVRSGIVEVQAL